MDATQGVEQTQGLPTCEEMLCNKRGTCVSVDNQMGCECMLGYQGPNCADTVNESLGVPLTLGVLFIILACVFLAFLWAFISQRRTARRRFYALKESNGVESGAVTSKMHS